MSELDDFLAETHPRLIATLQALHNGEVVDGYARYGLLARPGALPAARWLAVFSPATLFLGFVCVGLVLLLTPSGSLPSPRWRWWARLVAAGPVVFLLALAVGPGLVIAPYDPVIDQVTSPALAGAVGVAIAVAVATAVGGLAVGVWSLVVRFRRARGVEREQLRWVAFAAALTVPPAAIILIGVVVGATGRSSSCWRRGCAWRCCRWRSARRSCATACITWTASSAAPWPTGCSRSCSAAPTPGWP